MACFGGGMRTRRAGVILPRKSAIIGNTTMILPAQLVSVVAKRTANGPVVGLVQHQPPFIVGEPARRASSPACRPFSNTSSVTALMRNFFSCLRSSALRYFDLIVVRCEQHHECLL